MELSLMKKQQAALNADVVHQREALRALVGADSQALADLKPQPLTDAPHALPSHLGIELLDSASRTVLVSPTLTLPLFDTRRLSAQLDTARNARNQAIAEYNQSVVQEVRDVAQNGAQLQGIENEIVQQDAATASTRAQLQSAQARLAHGLADNAVVLNQQAALLKQQDAALSLQTMQQLAEVTLINALGGGYYTYRRDAASLTQNSK